MWGLFVWVFLSLLLKRRITRKVREHPVGARSLAYLLTSWGPGVLGCLSEEDECTTLPFLKKDLLTSYLVEFQAQEKLKVTHYIRAAFR